MIITYTEDQLKELDRNRKNGFPDLKIPDEKTPLELFTETYLSHYLRNQTPVFHREIAWLLQNRHIYPQLLLTAPRFFGKSIWACFFDIMYDICIRSNPAYSEFKDIYRPDLNEICLACETATKAKKWMRYIRREITSNKKILEDFGDLSTEEMRGEKWTEEILTFKTGLTVYGFGCLKGRGDHPQKLVLDDIESKDSAKSKEQSDKIEEWIKSTLFPMFETEYPEITWIGTILRAGCVIDNAYNGRGWDKSWYRRKWDCYDDKNESIWPDRWPTETLKTREQQLGSIIFGQEMRNKSYGSINPVYRQHHIRWYKREDLRKNMYIVVGSDPALSEKRSADDSSVCAVAVCTTGVDKMKIFVLDIDHGRWGAEGTLNKIFSFYNAYHPHITLFEKNGFQDVLKSDFDKQCLDRGICPVTKSVNQHADKWTRACNVVPLFEMGLVHFLEGHPVQQELINQLINFPSVSHDDMHDSLEICLAHIKSYVYGLKYQEAEESMEDEQDTRSYGFRKLGVA